MSTIEVVAGIIVNPHGLALMVRKHGTSVFIQPGGKPEPGETAATALLRELYEELGIVVAESELEYLGEFESAAANEPGFRVRSQTFWCHANVRDVTVAAEIAEARWVSLTDSDIDIAPLSSEHFFPLIRSRSQWIGAGPKIGTWR
ncbi:MAG: NUDIX domain-containing protein [Aeromicrobium sp.]|nr:MAG: NUDIX domain-containing protein [Aeromicrobium sp.]